MSVIRAASYPSQLSSSCMCRFEQRGCTLGISCFYKFTLALTVVALLISQPVLASSACDPNDSLCDIHNPFDEDYIPPDESDPDWDDDGWDNDYEYELDTDPFDPESNPYDPSMDEDSDGDDWSDWEESEYGSDPNDPNSTPEPGYSPDPPDLDSDEDGWPDAEEYELGSDPYDDDSTPLTLEEDPWDQLDYYDDSCDFDSDGDGWSDCDEILDGSDPNNSLDFPGSEDYFEYYDPYEPIV